MKFVKNDGMNHHGVLEHCQLDFWLWYRGGEHLIIVCSASWISGYGSGSEHLIIACSAS